MFFFTSDIHLESETTLKSDLRPFKNVKSFTKSILKTWNKQAGESDTIFVVGDFLDCHGENSLTWKKAIQLVKKIKAEVVLILGNNEERIVKYHFNNNFEEFKEYCLSAGFKQVHKKNHIITMGEKDFFLTHKPSDYNIDYTNLFGHVHAAGGIYYPFGLNVGCDLHHFRLLSEDDIFHLLKKKSQFWDRCKHLNMKF